MKKTIKILCVFMALAMLLLVISSCGGTEETTATTKEGQGTEESVIIATYDGKELKYDDIQQWVQYVYIRNSENIEDGSYSYIDAIEFAAKKYVLIELLEVELNKLGVEVTEDDINNSSRQQKTLIESTFNVTNLSDNKQYTGFEGWKAFYGVDDTFFYQFVKLGVLEEKMADHVIIDQEPDDSLVYSYYLENALNYAIYSGHEFAIAVVQAKDITNEEEANEAKAIAQGYINDLKNGTKTFEDVVKIVKETYNESTGYQNLGSAISTTYDFISETSLENYPKFSNLDTYLTELYNKYLEEKEEKDPKTAYEQYLFEVYRSKIANIFRSNQTGLCEEPIEFPTGYVILDYLRFRNSSWAKYETIKDEVKQDYLEANKKSYLEIYEENLLKEKSFKLMEFTVS